MSQQVSETPPTQPQVKVNVLNVCTPSAEEQKEIAGAVTHIPTHPHSLTTSKSLMGAPRWTSRRIFCSPGKSKMSDDPSVASYVRIRREFSVQAMFSNVQYSFSNDGKNMVETLVFHVRDPKELMQIAIEDSASAVAAPATMLAASTPASRIRLERFGKSSVVLARCDGTEAGPAPDQSAYEPLFQSASADPVNYRGLLGARTHRTG